MGRGGGVEGRSRGRRWRAGGGRREGAGGGGGGVRGVYVLWCQCCRKWGSNRQPVCETCLSLVFVRFPVRVQRWLHL